LLHCKLVSSEKKFAEFNFFNVESGVAGNNVPYCGCLPDKKRSTEATIPWAATVLSVRDKKGRAAMKRTLLQDKYPVFIKDICKRETGLASTQDIVNYLIGMIDDHPVTRLVGEFDHYSHTLGLEGGDVDPGIVDARNVVFCFGTRLLTTDALAVRPRSIGVAETASAFVVSFMEAPTAMASNTMQAWVEALPAFLADANNLT
jgi:hypothetical protein